MAVEQKWFGLSLVHGCSRVLNPAFDVNKTLGQMDLTEPPTYPSFSVQDEYFAVVSYRLENPSVFAFVDVVFH